MPKNAAPGYSRLTTTLTDPHGASVAALGLMITIDNSQLITLMAALLVPTSLAPLANNYEQPTFRKTPARLAQVVTPSFYTRKFSANPRFFMRA